MSATSATCYEVALAPMRTRDLRAVLVIEEAVYVRPWSHRLFADELAQRKSRIYRVGRVGRTLVGFAGLMLVDEDAHVNNIAVAPAWHGRSIGTVLLLDVVRSAIDHGSRHLTLEVRVGNEPAPANPHLPSTGGSGWLPSASGPTTTSRPARMRW
jgi:[ribosomal protein S18]-alanine N-acetyltransferase